MKALVALAALVGSLVLAAPMEGCCILGYAECTRAYPSRCFHHMQRPDGSITQTTGPYLDWTRWGGR